MGERWENTLINNWKLHQLSRWYETKYWCCVDAKGYIQIATYRNFFRDSPASTLFHRVLGRFSLLQVVPEEIDLLLLYTSWMQSELKRCRKENQSWYYHCCHSAPSVFKDGNFPNIPSTFSLSPRRRVALMRQTHASNLPITDVQHRRCVPISHVDPRLQSWICNQHQSTEKTVNLVSSYCVFVQCFSLVFLNS